VIIRRSLVLDRDRPHDELAVEDGCKQLMLAADGSLSTWQGARLRTKRALSTSSPD